MAGEGTTGSLSATSTGAGSSGGSFGETGAASGGATTGSSSGATSGGASTGTTAASSGGASQAAASSAGATSGGASGGTGGVNVFSGPDAFPVRAAVQTDIIHSCADDRCIEAVLTQGSSLCTGPWPGGGDGDHILEIIVRDVDAGVVQPRAYTIGVDRTFVFRLNYADGGALPGSQAIAGTVTVTQFDGGRSAGTLDVTMLGDDGGTWPLTGSFVVPYCAP